jgi:CrcB protein
MKQGWLLLMIAGAGALGSLARYGASVGMGWLFRGTTFPVGTFVVNITGAFALGWLGAMVRTRMELSEAWLLVVGTGFLGAYTTFSTYMLESDRMLRDGEWVRAAAYLAGSIFVGLLAVRVGMMAAGKP